MTVKNPLPPVVTEVLLLGLWSASAVQVAGYTFDAVKSTWSQLPGAGTGGGSDNAVQQSVNKHETGIGAPKDATGLIDSILHPFTFPKNAGTGTFGINGPITKWFEGIFGGGSKPKQTGTRRHAR